MTTVAPPTPAHQQDSNTRWYLDLMIDGMKPAGRPDVGRWQELVDIIETAYNSGVNGNRGKLATECLNSLMNTDRFPGLEAMLEGKDAPETPPLDIKKEVENEVTMPELPENARLPEGLSAGACMLMDKYVEYSKLVSPEGFEDYHPDVFLWVLSTIAARRIKIPFAQKEYTPLMVLLVADSSLYKKSTTARVGVNVLQAAGLRWLLGSDRTTPEKLLTDMAGQLPKNYGDLDSDGKFRIERRLSMAAQRGWRYDEFGELIEAFTKGGTVMQNLKGLFLQVDACDDEYTYSTQSRGDETIEKPYLSLIGCMTPPDMQEAGKTGSKNWRNGLLARFIFSVPPEETYKDCPFLFEELPVPYDLWRPLKDWHTRLGEPTYKVTEERDDKGRITKYLYHKEPLPEVTCRAGEGVYDAWVRYRSGLKALAAKKELKDFRASYDRFPVKAIRVAALLASLENNNVIEMKHIAKAIEIAERWRASLHELYSQINTGSLDEPSYAKKIEEEILRVVRKFEEQDKLPTLRDLSRYITKVDSGRIKMAVLDLVRAERLTEEKTSHATKYRLASEE